MIVSAHSMQATPASDAIYSYSSAIHEADPATAGNARSRVVLTNPDGRPRYAVAMSNADQAVAVVPAEPVFGAETLSSDSQISTRTLLRAWMSRTAFGVGWLFVAVAVFSFFRMFSVTTTEPRRSSHRLATE